MANPTSNFGWQMPTNTDLVKDLPADFEVFGQAVDTSLMDLKGGTTGQVLSKASNTDMDFTWVAQDDSNAIQNALLTTTGDTIYASGASTPARLGIGTTGQILTVAGGVPTWATPAASGFDSFLAPKVTGQFLMPQWTGTRGSQNPVQGTTYYHPIFLPGHTFDRILARAGGGSGTATVRMGIYNSDPTTKLPSTVYLDAGTATTSTWNTDVAITINSTPPAGMYYLAINVQTISAGNEWAGTNQEGYDFTMPYSVASITQTHTRCLAETGITGAFATAGTITSGAIRLTCGLRMA